MTLLLILSLLVNVAFLTVAIAVMPAPRNRKHPRQRTHDVLPRSLERKAR